MLNTRTENKKDSKAKVGKFILDTLSIGMYSNPLMLLREYVQNSVDAIDEYSTKHGYKNSEPQIEITINGRSKSITISDNGFGIPIEQAWSSLHDLGRSVKKLSHNRGFRGIGRLGGLGYCSVLKFITKAKGEQVYTVSEWDCAKLRTLLSHDNQIAMDVIELIDEVVSFSQYPYHESVNDHFFSVELHNVISSRDILMNVPVIKSYLAQVAPVPFDQKKFKFANKIEEYLAVHVPKYKTYTILVNKEGVYKPYTNEVPIGKGIVDHISDIKFIKFQDGNHTLAHGWLAGISLLGSISPTSNVDGIRLRTGNILVGDNYSLCELFRERRFNNYLVGEIHIVDHNIIPNSRRDGFEDNDAKDALYNEIIKGIGLPYSKTIREASSQRNSAKQQAEHRLLLRQANEIIQEGHLSDYQTKRMLTDLKRMKQTTGNTTSEIESLLDNLNKSKHALDKNHTHLKPQTKRIMKKAFDIVFSKCSNKNEAHTIAKQIMSIV